MDPAPGRTSRYPLYVLGLLFTINLFNYIDRQSLYAAFPLIKADLHLSDTELGTLASAFMLVYMCVAPLSGWWADRSARSRWLAGGVGLWSLATIGSGVSRSYAQLAASRAAVGVGEGCYGTVAPSFIAEYFSLDHRARALAIFDMAIPVGSALGFAIGGMLAERWGWRTAFCWIGVPGLLVAALAWGLRDPRRLTRSQGPGWKDYALLARNPVFITNTLANAGLNFGLGGLAAWLPSYYVRTWGISVSQASLWFGAVTVAAGLVGSLAGGFLGDWLLKRTHRAYYLLSGAGFMLCLPFGWVTLTTPVLSKSLICLFFAIALIFFKSGPLNALVVDYTPVAIRSMAFAVLLFFSHLLGDVAPPTIMGWVSDRSGLRAGLLLSLVAFFLAGVCCWWGSHYTLKEEDDTAELVPAAENDRVL